MTDNSPSDRINRASNEILEATSFLSGTNAAYLEQLYAQYQANPEAVPTSWRDYFASLGEKSLSPTQLGRGPEWYRDVKAAIPTDDLTGALTGQWPARKGQADEKSL